MRESIMLDKLKCQGSVATLARAIGPVKGIHDARVQIGHRRLLVEYDDDRRPDLDAALEQAGFAVVEREPIDGDSLV